MPINVYTGLQGSGKSYEVVSTVILDSIAQGRRVVTNVDGISESLIHDYLVEKRNCNRQFLGSVLHVTNEMIFKDDFFPYFDDVRGVHTDSIVQPGDLTAIDEAWRFWGSDSKIHKNHKSFFLEHRHFTNPTTGVACDLVLMIQDMGTLNRFVRTVVAFSFRTHKKVSLGLSNTYSISVWEGSKLVKGALNGTFIKKYNKDIFPLYSSFKGGVQGVLLNVDKRQNIFNNKSLWFYIFLFVLISFSSFFLVWRFFNPSSKSPVLTKPVNSSLPITSSNSTSINSQQTKKYSNEYRLVGTVRSGFSSYAVLIDSSGRLRLQSLSVFSGEGLQMSGNYDGQNVTYFSGPSIVPPNQSIVPGEK